MNFVKKIEIKIIVLLIVQFNKGKFIKYNLVSFGTSYGKWTVPKSLIDENSSCILAGAGDDISFDLELLHNYRCKIVICDPTPKSKNLIDNFFRKGSYEFTDFIGQNKKLYFEKETLNEKLMFVNEGIYGKSDMMEFFFPKIENHASLSILPNITSVNNNKSAKFKVTSLEDLIMINKIENISLIKLDIEGAEYNVIENFNFKTIPELNIICIEFHKTTKFYFMNLVKYCIILYLKGFKPVFFQDMFNVIFIKR